MYNLPEFLNYYYPSNIVKQTKKNKSYTDIVQIQSLSLKDHIPVALFTTISLCLHEKSCSSQWDKL